MAFFARYNIVDSYNIIPFKSITNIFKNGSIYSIIINIFGNLLIFVPLEYFIVELLNVKKIYINFVISFITVLIIEILQFIFKVGVFDVDDLILCVFGMNLFFIIYLKNEVKNRKYR